ncbi:hypothetical protein Q5752_006714 [Cryptotrichosporon argae]
MMCFKHFAIYAILLPVPSASPILLATFALALCLAVRPCGYCMALLMLLFVTTSPSSPFLTAPPPPPVPLGAGPSSPVPARRWLSTNGGRVFDPVLVGYNASAAKAGRNGASEGVVGVDSDESGQGGLAHWPGTWKLGMSATGAAGAGAPHAVDPDAQAILELPERLRSADRPASTASPPALSTPGVPPALSPAAGPVPDLPRHHVDARFRGLGFVVDFGWRRTDEGVAYELAHQGERAEAVRAAAKGRASPGAGTTGLVDGAGKAQGTTQGTRWSATSFLGSW